MTRRALPFLLAAAAITAVSGCTCSGDVSRFPVVVTPPSDGGGNNGNGEGGNGDGDGGNNVDICKIIVCPPPVDGGFSGPSTSRRTAASTSTAGWAPRATA